MKRCDSHGEMGRGPRALALFAAASVILAATSAAFGTDGTRRQDDTRVLTEAETHEGVQLQRDVIAPLVAEHCAKCHGPDLAKVKGGLRLSSREALVVGGSSGPAIDVAQPGASLLVRALRHESGIEMPPDERLPDEVVQQVERWIELGAPWPIEARETTEAERVADAWFETEIRPLLAANCFECHGPQLDEVEGGLRLASREHLLVGGRRGPAIVAGDASASLLVRALRHDTSGLAMPPDRALSADDVAKVERWIDAGARWPNGAPLATDSEAHGIDHAAARKRWPFTSVVRPTVPVIAGARDLHPIDAFLRAELADAGVQPNPTADEHDLVKRVFHDLVGLPPSADELAEFFADHPNGRFERLVERLLASPRFGERWARTWLDVVRFAQTNGYEDDEEKPAAWRYRDWVVDAFNADMPFEQFVRAQIAGDELFPGDTTALVATGFHRLGPTDTQTDDELQAQFDEYDDIVRTVSEGFLGLTVGCARCHDHVFDPIAQDDYYGLVGFVRDVRPYKADFRPESAALALADDSQDTRAQWERARAEHSAELEGTLQRMIADARETQARLLIVDEPQPVQRAWETDPADRTSEQVALVAEFEQRLGDRKAIIGRLTRDERQAYLDLWVALENLRADNTFEGDFEWVLCVREFEERLEPNRLLARGDPTAPLQVVEPHFPLALVPDDVLATPQLPNVEARGGRRAALATWVASPENPLTSRVIVNRLWQGLFGRGLVATPNDFGKSGAGTLHPELIDWLAAEFVARGSSMKELLRVVLASQAYRASSLAKSPSGALIDPSNTLFWRQNQRRLGAEALRDALLAASGELVHLGGGRGFFPALDRDVLAGASRPGEGWEFSSDEQRCRRALYAFVKRGMLDPLAVAFDVADPTAPVGARATTTTPTQALVLLNGGFVDARARALARRVAAERTDVGERCDAVIRAVFGRAATADELAWTAEHVERARTYFETSPNAAVFEPGVPDRVDEEFLARLAGADIWTGPTVGLSALRGRFHTPYNETLAIDVARGPARLVDALGSGGREIDAGRVNARVELEHGCTHFAVLVGAAESDGVAVGLEVRFDALAGAVVLARLPSDADAPPLELARTECPVAVDRAFDLSVEWRAGTVSVTVDGASVLSFRDSDDGVLGPTTGRVGFASWGGALRVERFGVSRDDAVLFELPLDSGDAPDVLALASLALVLFNSNEFVHVP